MPTGVPGCPEFAAWIASMQSVRIVATQRSSRSWATAVSVTGTASVAWQPWIPPASVVAGQVARRRRPPGSRLVDLDGRRRVEQRLYHAPGLLHGVLPCEVAGIALHRGLEEHLVRRRPVASEGRELHVELDGPEPIAVRRLRLHPEPRARTRPYPQNELVRLGTGGIAGHEAQPRRRVEDDADLRDRRRKRLARPDEEGHPRPAPAVDLEPKRTVR